MIRQYPTYIALDIKDDSQIIEGEPARSDLWSPIDLANPFQMQHKQSLLQKKSDEEYSRKMELTYSKREQDQIKAVSKETAPKTKVVSIRKGPLDAKKLHEDAKWFNDNFDL
ncbi:hypothetical protein [Methyloradius palustris]|uniref:Uncharacterized protein n=1 Tax=Methyloradius palustris TaxID=2778876 RepID=A0A8D5G419_9PROT|nr:hypothetical protein [Methyloradius palustris]BCM25598.1 hypothetical protein ZMTM_18570 [Methyloradius palustris]